MFLGYQNKGVLYAKFADDTFQITLPYLTDAFEILNTLNLKLQETIMQM